jgi:hypothetical protein
MFCDIINTATTINNNFKLTNIPYHFLTRKETEALIDLNILDKLKIDISDNKKYTQPFKQFSMEDSLKLQYQPLCNIHLQALIEKEKDYIYISMEHIVDEFKKDEKHFYDLELYKQFHLILQLERFDDSGMVVKNTTLTRTEYLKHQELARTKEKQYNLKYNLKEYYNCPCCLSTIASIAFYYKDNCGGLPTKISQIPKEFENALILVKNDRINITNLCNVAQRKFKSQTFEEYFFKIRNVCESRQWDYDKVITYIHKTHYDIVKIGERLRDKNSDNEWNTKFYAKSRNLNSPSWRSNIAV